MKCEGMSMNIEELKRLAEAATPGQWSAAVSSNMNNAVHVSMGIICDTGKNIANSRYIAAANPAAILELIRQRDELMAALKDARELVDDWGAYATAYMQEKHGLAEDLERLDAAISKVEKQS